jgi:lipopolysaccharide transport system permease protein
MNATAEELTAHRPLEVQRVVIKPSEGWRSLGLLELWRYRELLYFIAWRDVKVRYKQTALGATWAVIQPVLMVVVFSLLIGRFLPGPTKDVPYPAFAFCALVPWTFFSQSLAGASTSLVLSSNLVSKVYFPRLVLPLAAAASFLLDVAIGMVVLVGMLLIYGIHPGWTILVTPLLVVFALTTAVAVGIWLSALNVRYRDFVYAVPFMIQIWLFLSPVAYSSSVTHGIWHTIYGLNPMAGVIDGFRWAMLGMEAPAVGLMVASVSATLVILFGGLVYFARTERTFADVI